MSDRVKISVRDYMKYGFALVGAGIYVYAAYLLYGYAVEPKTTPDVWMRLSLIFSGIASIGLASIGVLLGVTIQQSKVTEAKADAQKKKDAVENALKLLPGPDRLRGSSFTGSSADQHVSDVAEARAILDQSLRSP